MLLLYRNIKIISVTKNMQFNLHLQLNKLQFYYPVLKLLSSCLSRETAKKIFRPYLIKSTNNLKYEYDLI